MNGRSTGKRPAAKGTFTPPREARVRDPGGCAPSRARSKNHLTSIPPFDISCDISKEVSPIWLTHFGDDPVGAHGSVRSGWGHSGHGSLSLARFASPFFPCFRKGRN